MSKLLDANSLLGIGEYINANKGTKLYRHHITFKFTPPGGDSQLNWEIYYFDISNTPCSNLTSFISIRNSPNYIFGHGYNISSGNEFMLALDPVTSQLYAYNLIIPDSAPEFETSALTNSTVSDWVDTVTEL